MPPIPMAGAVSDMLHINSRLYFFLLMKAALCSSTAGQMQLAAPAAGTLQRLSWQACCTQCLSTLVSYTCLRSTCAGRHLVPNGVAQGTVTTCQRAALPLLEEELHRQQELHSSLQLLVCVVSRGTACETAYHALPPQAIEFYKLMLCQRPLLPALSARSESCCPCPGLCLANTPHTSAPHSDYMLLPCRCSRLLRCSSCRGLP